MRTPTYRELSHGDCVDMLRRNTYGRIAFSHQDRVDIEPIHYVLEGDWIYLRTGTGTKLSTLRHHPWVAFEVDEVNGPFDWASVVVKGTVYIFSTNPEEEKSEVYQQALRALRRLIPETMTPKDPTPSRNVILRISLNEVHGRAAGA